MSTLQVNGPRMMARIASLAGFTDPDRPFTRRAFTDAYQEARSWLAEEFRSAGLDVQLDPGANLIGSRTGRTYTAGTIMLGSHIDTVVGGGRFDGIAGVIAALEVAQVLTENGIRLDHPLQIVDFLSEESSDYGASCIGSRAMVGTLSAAMLEQLNPAGERLDEAICRFGGVPERLNRPLLEAGQVRAFLELHIEQGPVLEAAGQPVGIVTGIAGIERRQVTITGRPAHAGTTPMTLRSDALVGAARFVELVSAAAREQAAELPFVSTVGRLDVFPNGANVVPGRVELVLEARSLDDALTGAFLDRITGLGEAACQELGLEFSSRQESFAPTVSCDPGLRAMLAQASSARGHAHGELPSGAGHDAMQMAAIAPIAMVFIPCAGGVSHHPEENVTQEDLVAGTEVLLDTVLELDRDKAGKGLK